jgi:hypothetical protein
MVKVLMTVGIVLLILASLVETAADISGRDLPRFLPAPLADFPSTHPATLLGVAGVAALVVGLVLELAWVSGLLPGGRVVVGLIAVFAFLLSGGYVFADG